MQFEFDPAKDQANQEKHGVSLGLAAEVDWDAALVWVDDRVEYGEQRMIALARRPAFSTASLLWAVARCEGSSACAVPIVVR